MLGRWFQNLRGRKTEPSPVYYGFSEYLSPAWARILGVTLPANATAGVSEEEALAIPTLFACLKCISEDVARHSFYAAKQVGHEEYLPEWQHPINRVLNWRANPEMSAYSFHEAMVFNAAFRRDSFAEITSSPREKVAALYPLHTSCVEVKRNEQTKKLEYVYNNRNGTIVTLPREAVLHIHGLSDDGITGMNWKQMHANSTLALPSLLLKMLNAFLRNDGRPSGIMSPPDNFPADVKGLKELEDAWVKRYAGDKKGRVAFSPPGFKYQQLGMDFDSAQIAELMQLGPKQICAMLRVPPSWVGLAAENQNQADDMTMYNVNGLGPWRSRLEGEFTRLVDDEGLVVIADEWELTRGDYKTRAEANANAIRTGVATRNEIRVKEGYVRIKEEAMDQPSIEWNSIPANKVADVMDARIAKEQGKTGPNDIANSPRDPSSARKVAHAFTSIAAAQMRGMLRRERDRLSKRRGEDYAKHAGDVLDRQEQEIRDNLSPIVESLAGVAGALGIGADHNELIETACGFHSKESRAKCIEQSAAAWSDEQVEAEAKRRSALLMDELAVVLAKECE